MAEAPKDDVETYFPISLTELDLSNVVGGGSPTLSASVARPMTVNRPGIAAGGVNPGAAKVTSTIMCCW